jgi:hypothetical protein
MNFYRKFTTAAEKHLKESGFVAELIEHHENSLLEFKLVSDMDLGTKPFRKTKRGENPLVPIAEMFIKVACAWPPEPEMFGVDLLSRFEPVLISIAERHHCAGLTTLIPAFKTQALLIHWLKIRAMQPSALDPKDVTDDLMRAVVDFCPKIILCRLDENDRSVAPHDVLVRACAQDGDLLMQIDPDLHTDEIVDSALEKRGYLFEQIQKRFVTAERCMRMIERNGFLNLVPQEMITSDMALRSLVHTARNMQSVPPHLLTEEFYLSAIGCNAEVASDISAELQNREFYRKAIAVNGRALYELRRMNVDEDLVIEAIDRNVINVNHLSESQLTEAVADFLVEKRPEALMLLPQRMRTPQLAIKALINGWPFAAMLIKSDQLTPEMLIDAVRQDYKVLTVLPKDLITEDMEMEALKQNGALLEWVNEDSRTIERCLAALTSGTEALAHIPDAVLESVSFQKRACQLNPQIQLLWGRPVGHSHQSPFEL